MASAERQPITGVWGLCPQEVQGHRPWSGGQGEQSPPFCVVICLKWRKAAVFMSCFMVINDSDCQRVYMRNAAAEFQFFIHGLVGMAPCPSPFCPPLLVNATPTFTRQLASTHCQLINARSHHVN